MAAAIWLLMILSPGLLLCTRGKRRLEEVLPLGAFLCAATIYGTGLFGLGRLGVVLCLLMAAASLLYTAVWTAKGRRFRQLAASALTPAMLVWVVMAAATAFAVHGMRSWCWDEIDHWQDTVRAMVDTGALGCARGNHLYFPHYPPALLLLQYPAAWIGSLLDGGHFPDWTAYFVYIMTCMTLLMPFLKDLTWKRGYLCIPAGLCAYALPMLFNHSAYITIYVDSFFGMLAGFCIAYAYRLELQSRTERCIMTGALCLLMLTKSSSELFALAVCVFLMCREGKQVSIKRKLRWVILPLAVYVSWKTACVLSGTHPLAKDAGVTLQALLTGQADMGFIRSVARAFRDALRGPMSVSSTYAYMLVRPDGGILLPGQWIPSYLFLSVLLTAMIYAFARGLGRKDALSMTLFSGSLLALYDAGIFLAYLLAFDSYEALVLASAERYLSVGLIMAATVAFALMNGLKGKRLLAAGFAWLLLTAALTPFGVFGSFFSDYYREEKSQTYHNYDVIADKLTCQLREAGAEPGEDLIWLASEDSLQGYVTAVILHHGLRPWHMDIEADKGLDTGEEHFLITAEAFAEKLSGYDYFVYVNPWGQGVPEAIQTGLGTMFPEGQLLEQTVYRVVTQENGVRLELPSGPEQ